jgi:hypothetical protein
MTRPIDPWASTDHDPTSHTQTVPEGEIFTTAQTLEFVRQAIHAAVDAHDDPHRRRQYAHSALSYANTVLTATDATADQREHAGYYHDDATAMLANIAS